MKVMKVISEAVKIKLHKMQKLEEDKNYKGEEINH